MSLQASKHMGNEETYKKWLAYFYSEADFGPEHGDVEQIMWENFLEENGLEEDIDEEML